MDVRPDTASSAFRGQLEWSFLHNSPAHDDAQTRSLPASSSYVRSDDQSSLLSPVLPLQSASQYHNLNGSRSSFSRNVLSTSTGARSTTTSQPICVPVHSADHSAHLQPTPRLSRKPIKMDKQTDLPAIEEFSFASILKSINEDVEGEINIISEILGRSRLVLADQHDSHMPPQGEILANGNTLQVVEEASASTEQLADDNVLILREDASLVDGSHSGSAAYGLLERLQAIPRDHRANSDVSPDTNMPESPHLLRHYSSPEGLSHENRTEEEEDEDQDRDRDRDQVEREPVQILPVTSLPASLNPGRGPVQPIVSETHLSAEFNHRRTNPDTFVPDSAEHIPLYTNDNLNQSLYHATEGEITTLPTPRNRSQAMSLGDLMGLSSWINNNRTNLPTSTSASATVSQDAEARLRGLLNR